MKEKVVMQIIRHMPSKSLKDKKVYCLFNLYKDTLKLGSMINLSADGNPDWYTAEVEKKFKNKEEAEKYAKKNKIKTFYSKKFD